jgi:ribosomal protein S18 acetylase RimI-like enzyme
MGSRNASLAMKCIRTLRREGVRSFCLKAAKRIGELLLVTNSADWYCADTCTELPKEPSRDGAIVDFYAFGDAKAWLREISVTHRRVYVKAEIDLAEQYRHVYPLLRVAEKRVGYIKVGFSRAYVSDFATDIAIPVDSAFVYDTFVCPEFRSCGMAKFMIGRLLAFLRGQGVGRVWCHIPKWNIASIKAYKGSGFVKAKRIRHFRILGRRLYTQNPAALMRGRMEPYGTSRVSAEHRSASPERKGDRRE